ncbi:MATE family efflux transporter [Pseudosulfitobacter sp. SM2401]|uniref:MATE family efflux transporter n=1 Tax=Pseudosulfitobacter sp. SM2401 TaxID=3350098 RepID=UPI0036F1D554
MQEGRFLTGSTLGHVVRMTATGAFGITFVFLVDAANLLWLSQLDQPELVAAIGFAYAIQFFSVSIGVGLMIATTAMVSRSIGRAEAELARTQSGAAAAISTMIQGGVALAILTFRHDLVAMAGATGETADNAAGYLALTIMSLIPMAISLSCSGTLRAYGYGKETMYVTLTSGLVLMVIDPILILYLEWGLEGAGVGLVLFRFCLMGLALYFAVYRFSLLARPTLRTVRAVWIPFMIVAGPAIATQMSTPVGNYILTIVMAPFGDDAVAAWAVVARLTVLTFGGIFALSGAIGGIFGQNFGAGFYDRVRSTYRDALIFCLFYTLLMWAVLASATNLIIAAFGLSGQGEDVLRAFTSIGVGGFVFVGALFVSNAAFNNLGKPGRSTLVNWLKDGVISWPAAAFLSASFGAAGVIYGQAVAGVIMGTLAGLWGWRYVAGLNANVGTKVAKPRPYPNPDRYRSR